MRPITGLLALVAVALVAGCAGPPGDGGAARSDERPAQTYDFTLAEPTADRQRPGSLFDSAARAAVPGAAEYHLSMTGLGFAVDGGLEDFTVSFEAGHAGGAITVIDYRPVEGEPRTGTYRAWLNASSPEDYAGPRLLLDAGVVERLARHTFQDLFEAVEGAEGPGQFRLFPGSTVEATEGEGYPLIVSDASGVRREAGIFTTRHVGETDALVGQVQVGETIVVVRFD